MQEFSGELVRKNCRFVGQSPVARDWRLEIPFLPISTSDVFDADKSLTTI